MSAWDEYVAAIKGLHATAGFPSSRSLATKIGGVSHTTVNQVIQCRRLPGIVVLSRIVEAMDGVVGHFRELWKEAHAELRGAPPPPPGGVPVSTQERILAELVAIRELLEKMETM
jgi:hypothetical protein